jgi:hypothetical protein
MCASEIALKDSHGSEMRLGSEDEKAGAEFLQGGQPRFEILFGFGKCHQV